jgi:cell wall-associated NlpC family hydrolase
MFDIRDDAIAHGLAEFPKEAVGVVIEGSYVPLENMHEDPENHFRVPGYPYEAEALVHTHTQIRRHPLTGRKFISAAPSRSDMASQASMDIPWGILPMQANGPAGHIEWFGDSCPIPRLLNRSFLSGSRDCWCLVRDFFRLQWGITLLNVPRDDDWYKQPGDEFDLLGTHWIEQAGFKIIDSSQARPGDVVLGSIVSRRNNHTGLICSRGRVLHQIEGRSSQLESLLPWQKFINQVVRHPEAGDWDGEELPVPN